MTEPRTPTEGLLLPDCKGPSTSQGTCTSGLTGAAAVAIMGIERSSRTPWMLPMDESIARTIILLGIGMGIMIWLVALRALRRIVHTPDETFQETTVAHDLKTTQRALLHAALNHKSRLSPDGVHVLNDDPDFVTFDLSAGTQVACELEDTYDGTKIFATADYAHVRRRYRFVMSILVMLVIPVVVGGVGYVLLTYAAPSANPGVRWQSIQILQITHALWPPFLVSKLFHANIDHANGFLRNLLVSAKLASDNLNTA